MSQIFKKVSREDVARYAGVDRATVSIVLNNTRPTSEETRRRVLNAVKKLNYVPDSAARTMKTNESYQLAIIVDNILDPMFSELIAHFEGLAMQNGYFVNICGGYGTFEQYITHLIARHIDGIFLAINLSKVSKEAIKQLLDNNIRICMGGWDREYYGDKVTFINVDVETGFRFHMNHLKSLGHKKAAYLSCFLPDDPLDIRARTYYKVHREVFDCEGFLFCGRSYVTPTIEHGAEMGAQMLAQDSSITAIICANDSMAVGVIKMLKSKQLNCPNDVSVLGINNDVRSKLAEPEITTFGADYSEFARNILQDLIGKNGGGNNLIVPIRHYIRQSTGFARKGEIGRKEKSSI